jgi:hypothetical protein
MVVSCSKWDNVGDEEADEEAREGHMDPSATFEELTPTSIFLKKQYRKTNVTQGGVGCPRG